MSSSDSRPAPSALGAASDGDAKIAGPDHSEGTDAQQGKASESHVPGRRKSSHFFPSRIPILTAAPWKTQVSCYLILYKLSETTGKSLAVSAADRFSADAYVGGTATLLLMRHHDSDVGAFDEVLFVPGRFQGRDGAMLSATRNLVSSEDAMLNRRTNWGLPAEVADFEVKRDGGGMEEWRVVSRADKQVVLEISLRPGCFPIPLHSFFMPSSWHTLLQHLNGFLYRTKIRGRGVANRAELIQVKVNPVLFPDISIFQPTVALYSASFAITFAEAIRQRLLLPSEDRGDVPENCCAACY